ncbi:MAG: metal-dependent hydrolase [Desulfobacterales bacterium]|nr:MAG: metal-dependent hydrolase [Desulfobacterales bacterium]
MNPVSHFLISWAVANTADISRRDRVLVTLCGVVPDLDGVGFLAELLTENSASPLIWYSKYHHVLCHNLGFGLLLAAVVFMFSVRKWVTAFLALAAFHLHLLGDLAGSRGPDSHQWPIPYLFPLSADWKLTWHGQWELNAWPNILLTLLFLGLTLFLAWKRGYSPLEIISQKADRALVSRLRQRFGKP